MRQALSQQWQRNRGWRGKTAGSGHQRPAWTAHLALPQVLVRIVVEGFDGHEHFGLRQGIAPQAVQLEVQTARRHVTVAVGLHAATAQTHIAGAMGEGEGLATVTTGHAAATHISMPV